MPGPLDVQFSDPVDWHDTHMDRGVLERDRISERMAAAGWLP